MKNKSMAKTITKLVILLIVLAGAGFGAYKYFGSSKDVIRYKTTAVVRTDLRSVIQATGTTSAVKTVDVGTQISGKITKLYIDYNSVVKKGQLIAEIDSATQQADVSQGAANLASARADVASYQAVLVNAKKTLDRSLELSKKDLIAKSTVDDDRASYASAAANVAAARAKVAQYAAALQKSQISLNYTKIYSPVDGIVVAKSVDEGQTVAASYQTPSIAEIAQDLRDMQVEVNVDEADIGSVKVGQTAEFTVDTFTNMTFKGKVTQVRLSPTSSNNVVTYTAVVKFNNDKKLLMPGMTANVSILVQEHKATLVVPNSAFRFKPVTAEETQDQGLPGPGGHKQTIAAVTKPTVYELDRKQQPVKVEVEKGITDGTSTEVLRGVKEGDRVITGIDVQGDK